MRFSVPIFYNVKSVISSLALKEWQKKLQTIEKIKFVESWTYESDRFVFIKINCWKLEMCENTRVCLDPQFKLRFGWFYTKLILSAEYGKHKQTNTRATLIHILSNTVVKWNKQE